MSGKMALIKKNQYIVPNHYSPMSGVEINPFHRKMLTFTLRCYMTHVLLKDPSPVWLLHLKHGILYRGKGFSLGHIFSPFLSFLQ